MSIIPALWEAKVGGLLEIRSQHDETQSLLKIQKPVTREVEAGELLEPGRLGFQ